MSLKRIFRFITVTVAVFLFVFFYQAYTLYKRSVVAQNWVTHTNVIINRLENIYANVWQLQGAHNMMLDVPARQRTEKNIRINLDSLLHLTKDNKVQQARLNHLSELVDKKLLLLQQPRDQIRPELIRIDDSLKTAIGLLIGIENELLNQRTRNFEYYSRRRFYFSLFSFTMLGLFLFISLYYIYRNFSRRITAERLARSHEEKYKTLIEHSQFTTAIIGLDKVVKFVSANVTQLTGVNREELTGKVAAIHIPTVEEWHNVPGRSFMDFEMKIEHRNDGKKWIAYRLFPLEDEQGEIREWQIVAWDVDMEKNMEEEIASMARQREQQQNLLQNIIDNIPSAIYIKDRDGRYVIVNKKLCEMWNFRPSDVLGRRDVDVFPAPPGGSASYQVADAKVLQHKGMVTQEDSIVRNGRKEYFWIVKFPLLDEHGEVQNICGLATEITDRKENELKLIQATRAAETARIAQESFLANMSHEIRTPMNGIMGMSNLLLSTRQNAEQQEYAENILESARHLLAIINDILDFSKIKAGKFQFEYIPFKPRHTIKKALYPLQLKAEEKMVKLSLDMDDEVPEVLTGDPLRLQQIIINLVGNALKFTQEGSVQIVARCKESGPDSCQLEVLVKDTGIGIPQNKLQMIFESFTQNNVNTSRKYGGTGLGLAIVKQLVELQKGRVWVESTQGIGSVFGFVIPYKIGKMPAAAATLRQAVGADDSKLLEGIRVLVAEDNLINQKVVNITLSKQGADVKVVSNGQLAVNAILHDAPFDVVLMDLQMPEVDGYKATRIIRAEIDAMIPIIAMTADALKGEAEKCFEAGMNGYISKPFEPRELYQEILRLVKKHPAMKQDVNDQHQVVDFTYLYELAGNDPAYISEVLDLFLGTMPEGLKLLEHLIRSTDDWDRIYRQSHFLKSSVSVVHVVNMMDLLSEIEQLAQKNQDKERIVQLLDQLLSIYQEAHPILLAERAKHNAGKI